MPCRGSSGSSGFCNDLVDIDAVMGPFSREALVLASAAGAQPVLIIDQSTITQFERHELVTVALRVGKRAIPIAWRVYRARGSLGWREQIEVLEVACSFLPDGCKPLLMGDRFYGNADIISWFQAHGWDYCLRLGPARPAAGRSRAAWPIRGPPVQG